MDTLIKASAHALAAGDPLAPSLGPVFIAAREFAKVLFTSCMRRFISHCRSAVPTGLSSGGGQHCTFLLVDAIRQYKKLADKNTSNAVLIDSVHRGRSSASSQK